MNGSYGIYQDYNGMELGMAIIGSYLINPGMKQGLINIPKCASTMLKIVAQSNGYTYQEAAYQYDENLVFATIIREPWERYLSGLSEYVVRYYTLKQDINQIYKQLFETGEWVRYQFNQMMLGDSEYQVVFDEHTTPQYVFIKPFLNNQVDLLRLEHSDPSVLSEQLATYLNLPDPPQSENVSPLENRNMSLDLGKKLLDRDDDWFEAWKSIFIEDIKLWEKTKG